MESYMRVVKITNVSEGAFESAEKQVLTELRMPCYVNGEKEHEFTCTPEYQEELILGYLYTEGLIFALEDVIELQKTDLGMDVIIKDSLIGSNLTKESSKDLFRTKNILESIDLFYQRSFRHAATKASHKAMLCLKGGTYYEADDVSRRSAVEKVVGIALKNHVDLSKTYLVFSGRVPADVIEKLVKAQIPMIVARSNPTYEAIQLALEHGIVICGNAKEDSFNIYTGNERFYENERK